MTLAHSVSERWHENYEKISWQILFSKSFFKEFHTMSLSHYIDQFVTSDFSASVSEMSAGLLKMILCSAVFLCEC
jgi:hypothetical protein